MLVLVCGIHNAGKTTYAQRFGIVVHLDELGSYDAVCDAVRGINGDIAVDGLYPLRVQRRRLLEACGDRGKNVCIWLDAPLDECIRREDRGRPLFVIRKCASAFEPPTLDEGWDEIIRILLPPAQHRPQAIAEGPRERPSGTFHSGS